jgi:hypothetical protein
MTRKMRLLRLKVHLKRITSKLFNTVAQNKEQLSPIQRKAISVIKRLIAKEGSLLLISPISSVYHVEYKNILIRLQNNDCQIMNSTYTYFVYLPNAEAEGIHDAFKRKMEMRTNRVVSAYEKKTLENLQTIIENIDK